MKKADGDTIGLITDFVTKHQDGCRLPEDVRHAGRRSILNVLGASVGAMDTEPIRVLRRWAQATAPGTHRVLWTNEQLSEELAALVNAAGMHVLDFDDTLIGFHAHASAATLATGLAVAKPGTDGRDLLNAFCIGMEVHFALAKGLMPDLFRRGFHISAIGGTVASAVVAGVLQRLDDETLRHSIAGAMIAASGLREGLVSMSNAFGVGNAARTGISAVRLAQHGFRSTLAAFDGSNGLRHAMSGANEVQAEAALSGLGEKWNLLENSFKRFPTETISQAAVQALLTLHAGAGDRARTADVTGIHIEASPLVAEVVAERSSRTVPNNVLTRTFDTRFCAASTWLTGRFSPASMMPDPELETRVLELRERVLVTAEPAFGTESARVTVMLASGESLQEMVDGYLGCWSRPMGDVALEEKLLASGGLSLKAHRTVCDAVWSLGIHGTVGELLALLGPLASPRRDSPLTTSPNAV